MIAFDNAHLSPLRSRYHARIEDAALILRAGGLVAMPTETVYGLAANALDEQAVARVFEVKGRPKFDPLIVHVHSLDQLLDFVTEIPALARKLAAEFWPGPLTMVLPKSALIPDLVTAGAPTVAVRIPDHKLARELLKKADLPLAAPSANPFGRISPTTAAHVRDQLGDKVDMVLNGGPCRVGVESTVIDCSGEIVRILRPGGVTAEEIERVVGKVEFGQTPDPHGPQASPGLLAQHYAPRTPLSLLEAGLPSTSPGERLGLLAFVLEPGDGFACTETLSPVGDLREAAANLFAAMRRLDAAGLSRIIARPVPERDLGRAINDRLRRAAAGSQPE